MNQRVKRILCGLLIAFCYALIPVMLVSADEIEEATTENGNETAETAEPEDGTSCNAIDVWSDSKLRRYAEDNILYYDDQFGCEVEPPEEDCEQSGETPILEGNSNLEKIWNWIATAGISGVSDNPAVIAGILGNFQQESGFNPFIVGGGGNNYYGLFQTNDAGLRDAFDKAGISGYWGSKNVPEDAVDTAIDVTLNYLFYSFGHTPIFLNNLNQVSHTAGPAGARSYAELFLTAVERGVNGDSMLEDAKVQNFVNTILYPNNPQYHNKPYQATGKRRDNAETIYNTYAGSNPTGGGNSGGNSGENNESSSESSGSASWSNGWLVDNSIPGIVKQEAVYSSIKETYDRNYNFTPNKIVLHNTEGTTNGLNAYPASNYYPAHFTIDLKKKQGYQHFPLTQYSTSLAGGSGHSFDKEGPIQIEIVGFSTAKSSGSSYYLPSFSDDDWDYLAVLLIAIAEQTGISLSTSQNWASPARISADSFAGTTGILGHMHAPSPNNHVDPGNIWEFVEAALNRNPDASRFKNSRNGGSNYQCLSKSESEGQLLSGGMTESEARDFMSGYINEASKKAHGSLSFDGVSFSDVGCSDGTLNNCSAFSLWFANKYAGAGATQTQGSRFVKSLISNYGFTDGGKVPRVYAIFSTGPESGNADGWANHTGVVLGINEEAGTIITGEASCHNGFVEGSWPGVKVHNLSEWTNNSSPYGPTYAYKEGVSP